MWDWWPDSVNSTGAEMGAASKLSLAAFETLPASTPYDVVIHVNNLPALKTSDWEMVLGKDTKELDLQVPKTDDGLGVIVAVFGLSINFVITNRYRRNFHDCRKKSGGKNHLHRYSQHRYCHS